MDGRAADEAGFGCGRSRWRWCERRWQRSLNARWRIGKQLVEAVERGTVRRAAQIERWAFHFGCGRQIGALFADFRERRRWLNHHHAAALRTGEDLANGSRVAHLQPGFAGSAGNCKKFHAAYLLVAARFCPVCAIVSSESFVGVVQVKAVPRRRPMGRHKKSCHRHLGPFLLIFLTVELTLITFSIGVSNNWSFF